MMRFLGRIGLTVAVLGPGARVGECGADPRRPDGGRIRRMSSRSMSSATCRTRIITNQFASYGATFTNFGWDNATLGQAGSTGFTGGNLANGASKNLPSGPMTISFTNTVSDAAFAAVDQDDQFTITAYLGSLPVDTFNVTIPANPGIGFIGFTNLVFDRITITTLNQSALSIDTLQFNTLTAVPEPSTLISGAVAGLLLGLGYAWRRQQTKAVA